jgi:hypothetical protein
LTATGIVLRLALASLLTSSPSHVTRAAGAGVTLVSETTAEAPRSTATPARLSPGIAGLLPPSNPDAAAPTALEPALPLGGMNPDPLPTDLAGWKIFLFLAGSIALGAGID